VSVLALGHVSATTLRLDPGRIISGWLTTTTTG
jgi:hypothetical protein